VSNPAARYLLGEEIARGGMGVIHRATDTVLGREVAVKVLQEQYAPDSGMARRFADEARITGQLQHPNIPAVHDLGVLPDGRPFLAMKLIKGGTLADLLKSATPVDRLAVFEAVAQAVGYAHAHGVIHRDLKPANVMVGSFGEVQVMDWGLAKVLAERPPRGAPADDPDATTAPTEVRSPREPHCNGTQPGSVLGTPAFMAPEQAAGKVDRIDARSDVFGLGAILCVLLTGKPPFDGRDAEAVRVSAVCGKTEGAFARLDASEADADVIALCKRCLAFEPADRPADAEVVASEVASLRRAADDRARQAEWDQVAAAAARFIEDRVFAAARPKGQDGGLGKDVTLRDALAASLPALAADFADQPLVEARLRVTLGTSFLYLGEPETAAAQFLLARQLYIDHRGPDHPDTLCSIESLAASYADLGRHAEALQLRTEVLTRRTVKLGPDHADTVAMSELAKSYNALGRHAEALPLREQVLALRKVRPGPDHADTLASMKDLAATYYFLGRHVEALQLRDETLALRKVRLPANHPDTLQSMFDVAVSYLALGRNAEALVQLEENRQLRETALGPTHPDTLWTLWGVAASHAALGRHAEALRGFEQTFELRKDKLGPDHPDTLWTVWGLAKSLVALGRGAEAVPLIDECVLRHAGQVAYPRLIPGVLDVRLRYFAGAGDAVGCRQTAAMWEAVNRPGAVGLYAAVGSHDENRPNGDVSRSCAGLYTAAQMRAVTAGAFERSGQLAEANADAGRAMAWLCKAVAAGYQDRDHMEKDRDLDALRGRGDFQALVATLSIPSEITSPPGPAR
jgi:tetratricopeptide (TPR) repeat protein